MAPKTRVDERSGEVITISDAQTLAIPDMKTVSDINKVAGKNPPSANLRDHPEFSGMELIAVGVKFGSGDIGGKHTSFVVIGGYLVAPGAKPKDENLCILITGADNVYARLSQAFVENALPVRGTLRKSGRAWFLD